MKKIIISFIVVFILFFMFEQVIIPRMTSKSEHPHVNAVLSEGVVPTENILPPFTVLYTQTQVPDMNTSFKTYMDYRAITDRNSNQYKFIYKWAWTDGEGFMRCNGERDLGIKDDYYLIALGSYYGTSIGTKYRITLDTGRVFYGVLADCKANIHTNSTNQYGINSKDVVEFLVDIRKLNKNVKYHGSANVYMPLNGSVAKIERIDFIAR